MDRLWSYPYIFVRVECTYCPHRKGAYRLARLAAKYGADIPMEELLANITFDCPYHPMPHRRAGKYVPTCHARFVDLEGPRPPPDLPPRLGALRVIKGGKA